MFSMTIFIQFISFIFFNIFVFWVFISKSIKSNFFSCVFLYLDKIRKSSFSELFNIELYISSVVLTNSNGAKPAQLSKILFFLLSSELFSLFGISFGLDSIFLFFNSYIFF